LATTPIGTFRGQDIYKARQNPSGSWTLTTKSGSGIVASPSLYNKYFSAVGAQPPAGGDQPSGKDQPGAGGDKPAAGGDQPGVGKEVKPPPIANNTPTLSDILDQVKTAYPDLFKPVDYNAIMNQVLAQIPKLPEPPPTLSYAEAKTRAEGQLNPLYDELLDKSLKAVDDSNIRRGFFGQLPGAALSRSTAADVSTRKAQAIGQLTNQLVGQSEEAARAQQALGLQKYGIDTNTVLGAFSNALNQENMNRNTMGNLMNTMVALQGLTADKEKAMLPWTMGATPAQMLDWANKLDIAKLPWTQGMTEQEKTNFFGDLLGTILDWQVGMGGVSAKGVPKFKDMDINDVLDYILKGMGVEN